MSKRDEARAALKGIVARYKAATRGPWVEMVSGSRQTVERFSIWRKDWFTNDPNNRGSVLDYTVIPHLNTIEDALFVANARQDIPLLVAAFKKSEAHIAALEESLRAMKAERDGRDE